VSLATPQAAQSPASATIAASRFPLWAAIALALAAAALVGAPQAAAVWGAGEFFDSDDALRAVEVRDLLAGQNWFDMTARRIDPPHGLLMHWSRVVDAPLAALEWTLRLVLAPEMAERAARLVFPFGCLALLLALVARNARILGGGGARIPAVFATFLTAPMLAQFVPGRIDHHAPQIVLLTATLGFFAQGLDPAKARAMALAAATMSLSLAISLENLPFFAVMLAAPPILFVLEGEAARRPLGWFALGALVFAPACFAATVAPSLYGVSACDAFSAVHLGALLVGAGGLAALAILAPRLGTRLSRGVGVALAAAGVLAAILLSAPQCLGDPLGGLDPLLRDLWLSHVAEAKPVASFDLRMLAVTALPVALGFAAALVLASGARGVERWRWATTAAAILVGFAAAAWQIRVFSSVMPLAATALACAAVALGERLAGAYSALLRGSLVAVLLLLVSPMGLALALPSAEEKPRSTMRACLEAKALAPLAEMAPARVVAPVDMGSHLLAFTPHSVFAAPYHRDNRGNRLAVDAFLASPSEAERMLRAAGAGLVLWCAGGETGGAIVERAPFGLAAVLARGETPDWLEKIPLEGTPVHVFALRAAQ
jgi:hypothetical protein